MDKKIFLTIFLLFFCVLGFTGLHAQEIPVLKDIQIRAEVGYKSGAQIFSYSYTVTNPPNNTGGIIDVQVDISKPQGGKDLSAEGFTISHGVNPRGMMLIRSFEEEIFLLGSTLEKSVIPVGTKAPDSWSSYISVRGTIGFGSKGKVYRVMPGNSLNGFEILSRGLPAIRSVEISPFWILSVEDFVTEEDIEKHDKITEQITLFGKTIGPTAPPVDSKPIEFLDYIILQKHEASKIGWIKNAGIENSLDAKLDNAKKSLQGGNIQSAKNILNAFINEVEAQGCKTYDDCPSGKHLTPEAYALLKYNMQYLIDNLK